MESKHRFPYEWRIADGYPANGIEAHNSTVFGTFICGGGSSMGYKLAGYHHIGGVEIDPKIAAIYRENHNPEHLYVEDLRLFNNRTDLPPELFKLDLLDGSPPCSTFSMAGSREGAWGKKKQFAEGQALQTLDDLVFVYCDTILKLMPKCFLLENVKGLTAGNAKSYVKRVFDKLRLGGYECQLFVCNAATMGVPQKRERAFIIGHRKEYVLPKLVLKFDEKPIYFREVIDKSDVKCDLTNREKELWDRKKECDTSLSDTNRREFGKSSRFTCKWLHSDSPCNTLTTSDNILYDFPRKMNGVEIKRCGSFPQDYKFPSREKLLWMCGMSVPPVMTANIAYEIWRQWIRKINEGGNNGREE